MTEQANSKSIAKNTIFLYFRMLFTMGVTLYTSRVILEVLGVDNYGIYQTVAGVIGMLSFINGALSVGSSRFLTFEMGTGDFDKLRRTFSSVLTAHLLFAFIVVLLAESLGLWFVETHLVIPRERMDAAVFAYHFSIIAAVFQITQIPYNASIISHEKMSIYAYMSIVEVSLKLLIVYALFIGTWDQLKLYSILLCVVNILIALAYRVYCIKNFEETHYTFMWDKPIMKEVLSYSGWNLFANTSRALRSQGGIILLNIFFNPSVVAGNSIANQVNMAANQFVQNFRTAVTPQIVKRYASGDYNGSKRLLLSSTKFSFYLMLLLSLPIMFLAQPVLSLWLIEVPQYAVVFLQFAILTSLFQVFDTSFYTALYAKGQIKENALISPMLGFLTFPIMYLFFYLGYSPLSMAICSLILYIILGLLVKPLLLIKIVDYTWSDIISVYKPCFLTCLSSLPLPIFLFNYLDINYMPHFLLMFFVTIFNGLLSIWFIGLDKSMKLQLVNMIKKKLILRNA